jgi:hypothetical protein
VKRLEVDLCGLVFKLFSSVHLCICCKYGCRFVCLFVSMDICLSGLYSVMASMRDSVHKGPVFKPPAQPL